MAIKNKGLVITGVLIGAGLLALLIYEAVKPSTASAKTPTKPGTSGGGDILGGGTPGTTAPSSDYTQLPMQPGQTFTLGTRNFVVKQNGFAISGYTNSPQLQSTVIPFPKYSDGTYVSDQDHIQWFIRIWAANLGDGLGWTHDENTGAYQELINAGVQNLPSNY